MTAVPFIVGLAALTLLLFIVMNLRAAKGPLSAQVLLRFYLYVASFVTLVIFVAGAIYLLTGLFSLASPAFSYARPAPPVPAAVAGPGARPAFDTRAFERQTLERQRDQQSTDLIRGGTLAIMGGGLFLLHAWLRRRRSLDEEAEASFHRGFLVVALATFGLVGLVALPVGVYQVLKFFLTSPLPTQTRVAPGNTLATGLILTPLWIAYLLALMGQARASNPGPQLDGALPQG